MLKYSSLTRFISEREKKWYNWNEANKSVRAVKPSVKVTLKVSI